MSRIPQHLILNAEQEEDLIQRKLNNIEAPLRRRIQQISQLLASSAVPSVEGEGSDVTMQSTEGDDDQLKAEQVWTLFNAQLREVEFGVKKVGIVERMEERMRAKYEAKGKQIELNKANLQRDIIDRRAQLVQAEDTRRRKLEYDVLARQILAVGDRSTLEAEIAQAGEELSRSLKEKGGVKETLGRRKKAFTALMGGLKDVRDMVPPKDEQEEEEEADLGEGTSGKEVTPAAEGTTPTVEGDAEAFGEGKVPVPEDDEEDDPARRTAAVTRQPTPTSTSTDTPSLDAEKPAEPQFISAHKTLDPSHEEDGSELANVEDALALGELTETETVATPAPSVGHPSSEARQPLPVDETKPGSHELSSKSSTILVDIPTKESSSLSDLEMLASATKKEDTPEEDVDERPSSMAGAKGKGEGRRLTSDTRTSVPTRCSSRSISPVKPSTSTPSSPSKKTRSSGRKSSSPTKEALQEVEDEADEDEPTPASGGRPKRGAAKSTKEPPAKKPRTSGGSKR